MRKLKTDKGWKRLHEEYIGEAITLREIAKREGCDYSTIAKAFKRLNLERKPNDKELAHRCKKTTTPDELISPDTVLVDKFNMTRGTLCAKQQKVIWGNEQMAVIREGGKFTYLMANGLRDKIEEMLGRGLKIACDGEFRDKRIIRFKHFKSKHGQIELGVSIFKKAILAHIAFKKKHGGISDDEIKTLYLRRLIKLNGGGKLDKN